MAALAGIGMQMVCLLLALFATSAGYLIAASICRMTVGGVGHAVGDIQDYFTPDDTPYNNQRRARQVELVLASSGLIGLINIFNVTILTIMLLSDGVSINIVWWSLMISIMASFQLMSAMRLRGRALTIEKGRRLLQKVILNAGIFGLVWGLCITVFHVPSGSLSAILILLALLGTAAGGVASLAALPPAAILFCAAIGGQVVHHYLSSGAPGDLMIAAYGMSFMFMLGALTGGVYGAAVKRPALKAVGRGEECGASTCQTTSIQT